MGKVWNRVLLIIESLDAATLDQIIGTIFSGRRDNGKQVGKRKTYLPESGSFHTATRAMQSDQKDEVQTDCSQSGWNE